MFKKLKSLFVIEDENSNNESDKKPTSDEEVKQSSAKIEITKPQFDPENPPKGKVSEKFVNRLLGAIEDGNLKGFDYLEYKQALQNLSKVDMDEATKYKSAMAMAQTMGASRDSLLDAAKHYVQILSKEEQKFLEAFQNQRNRQVNDSNEQLKSLESGIALKKKRIEELKKEIEADTTQLNNLKSSIDSAKSKVEATKDSFYHAFHIVNKQILDDIKKMEQYLK